MRFSLVLHPLSKQKGVVVRDYRMLTEFRRLLSSVTSWSRRTACADRSWNACNMLSGKTVDSTVQWNYLKLSLILTRKKSHLIDMDAGWVEEQTHQPSRLANKHPTSMLTLKFKDAQCWVSIMSRWSCLTIKNCLTIERPWSVPIFADDLLRAPCPKERPMEIQATRQFFVWRSAAVVFEGLMVRSDGKGSVTPILSKQG